MNTHTLIKKTIKNLIAAAMLIVCVLPLHAAVPSGPPVFSNPTVIDNAYYPFVVGALRVYVGKSDGARTSAVYLCTNETRDFPYNNGTVTTRVLREINYQRGKLVEYTDNFFAQADDGTVYYFGETVYNYDAFGVLENNDGSWLVGGPTLPSDPASTATTNTPAVYMPANPELDDVFKPENIPTFVDETDTVLKVGVRVTVTAGRFTDCLHIQETSLLKTGRELKWWAKGIGVVKTKGKGEYSNLIATSFRQMTP